MLAYLAIRFACSVVSPELHGYASSDSVKRGAELFATSGCGHCHGPAGLGGGTGQGPNLQDVKKRLKGPAIALKIHDGGRSMPAFGDQFTQDQIADLVDYLRSKRKP